MISAARANSPLAELWFVHKGKGRVSIPNWCFALCSLLSTKVLHILIFKWWTGAFKQSIFNIILNLCVIAPSCHVGTLARSRAPRSLLDAHHCITYFQRWRYRNPWVHLFPFIFPNGKKQTKSYYLENLDIHHTI